MRFNHSSGDYLDIEGTNIYYEVIGNKTSPALVFLHGGFGNIEDFNPILDGLDKTFRIVGIDSRGQGKSTLGQQTLNYERIQKDVEQILEHLEIDTFSVIGFSDGGIVSYRLASLTSLKIKHLVTIGSRWHYKNTIPTKELFLKITPESWKTRFPFMYEAYQELNPQPDFDTLTTAIINMWLDSFSSGYPNEDVANIDCPLLIVRGDEDHLISLEAVFELIGIVKNTKLLNIPFAGHSAFTDQNAIFMRVLNEFLK